MDNRAVGAMVKDWRRRRVLTQCQLAEKVHVSQSTISQLECGQLNATVRLLSQLATAFGCRLEVSLVPLDICQVAHRNVDRLTCQQREVGGYQCERLDPHGMADRHEVGEHTSRHDHFGSWYDCRDVDNDD